jgi:hypothetical protein
MTAVSGFKLGWASLQCAAAVGQTLQIYAQGALRQLSFGRAT